MAERSCAHCGSAQPPSAHFCHRCGRDHVRGTAQRPSSFVARPSERVRWINPVTALMPLTSGTGVRGYEVAVTVGVVVPLVAAALGWVAFAIVAAALAVPAVFTVYLYDVDEWDDQPLHVVVACLVVSGVLGVLAALVVGTTLLDRGELVSFGDGGAGARSIVALGVVAPLLALVVALLGPLWLAARPRFDDLLDGLTFGAVSGAASAAGETLTMHRGIFGTATLRRGDVELWLTIVANAAIVKPVIYATATAIAVAGFSGIGPGHEGFGRRFRLGATIAAAGMVGYGLGLAVLDEIGGALGAALGLGWGLLIAAALVVVLRTQLHLGILEAALQSAHGKPSRHETSGSARCGECQLPLAQLALFCSACGTSVRATSKTRQRFNGARPATAGGGP